MADWESDFEAADKAMTVDVFRTMGRVSTYSSATAGDCNTRAIITKDVQVFSDAASAVPERRTEADLLKADVGVPDRGDTLRCGSDYYTVQDLIEDDGIVVKVSIK